MKIQKGAGPKAAEQITPTAPAAWEPCSKHMQELERSIMGYFEFFSPWRAALEFEFAPFELRETEQGFTVSAAMPGFKESEIEVRVEPRRLFLHAQHEEPTQKKREPIFEEQNEFTRWVDFPSEVNPEKVKAVLSKGVLEITLEKAQTAKKVEVHPKAA